MSDTIALDRLRASLRTGAPVSHEMAVNASKDGPRDTADWSNSPQVKAGDLRAVLLGLEPSDAGHQHPSGLTIVGLRVVGALDLSKGRLSLPFTARDCLFEDAINLDDAEGVSIGLPGSRLQGGRPDESAPKDDEQVQSLRGDGLRLRGSLSMGEGFIAEHGVWLGSAKIDGQVDCAGCTLCPDREGNALTAFRLQVGNGLLLTRAATTGRVDLTSAQIGYGVDLTASRFHAAAGPDALVLGEPVPVALDLADAVIDGSLVAHELVHISGQWSLYSANVGDLYLGGGLHAEVEPTQVALEATGLQCVKHVYSDVIRVTGSVVLDDATVGSLRLPRGRITTDSAQWALSAARLRTGLVDLGTALRLDSLNLAGASIGVEATLGCQVDSGTLTAMTLENATVTGRLTLPADCSITGWADWSGLSVGGDCLVSAAWHCAEGVALKGKALSVGGQLTLDPRDLEGSVDLTRADVGLDLVIAGSLGGTSGVAVTMASIHVKGSLSAAPGCRIRGRIDVRGARIDGDVAFTGVHCGDLEPEDPSPDSAPEESRATAAPAFEALDLSYTIIGGSLYLYGGFCARGTTQLFFAQVGGVVNLRGGSFIATGQEAPFAPVALSAEGLRVASLVAGDTTFAGRLSLDDAVIQRINLTGAEFAADPGPALSALRMSTAGALVLCPARLDGGADLRHASVGLLRLDRMALAGPISALGLEYRAIDGQEGEDLTAKDFEALLPKDASFAAQPYLELAQAHRASGQEEAAKEILIELRAQQARQKGGGRLRKTVRSALDLVLRRTVGFGYYPLRAVKWLFGITLVGTLVFWLAHPENLEPARASGVPAFNAFFYSLDTTLPIVDFTQQAAWTPYHWAQWWAWISIASGWVLSTALVAGVTRAIRS